MTHRSPNFYLVKKSEIGIILTQVAFDAVWFQNKAMSFTVLSIKCGDDWPLSYHVSSVYAPLMSMDYNSSVKTGRKKSAKLAIPHPCIARLC